MNPMKIFHVDQTKLYIYIYIYITMSLFEGKYLILMQQFGLAEHGKVRDLF
jgi:hypothetical protein